MKREILLLIISMPFISSTCVYLAEEDEDYFPETGKGPFLLSVENENTGGPYEDGIYGGFVLTLTGGNFTSPEDMTVVFGSRNAEVVEASDSSMKVISPTGPMSAGRVDVRVSTSYGIAILEDGYEYRFDDNEFFENERGHISLVFYQDYDTGLLYGLFNDFRVPRLVTTFNNYGYILPASADDRPPHHGEMVLEFDTLMEGVEDGEVYILDEPPVRIAPLVNYDYPSIPIYSPTWAGEEIVFVSERDFTYELGQVSTINPANFTICTEEEAWPDYKLDSWDENNLYLTNSLALETGEYMFGITQQDPISSQPFLISSGRDLHGAYGSDLLTSTENSIVAEYNVDYSFPYTHDEVPRGKFMDRGELTFLVDELGIEQEIYFTEFVEPVEGSLAFYKESTTPHRVIWKAPTDYNLSDYLIISVIYFYYHPGDYIYGGKITILIDESSEESDFFYSVSREEEEGPVEYLAYQIPSELIQYLPEAEGYYTFGAISRHKYYSLSSGEGDIIVEMTAVGESSFTVSSGTPPECADGEDNDGDGYTDFLEDPECDNLKDYESIEEW